MTIAEAIDRVDRLKYNAYSLQEKREWLRKVEWMIKWNILDTHGPGLPFRDLNPDSPANQELIAPAPFDELYVKWLEAQIDLYNGEAERYNGSIALFNREFEAFESWYNRSYVPVNRGTWKN